MDRDVTKLIIIRGPSGAGKSTVAQALMKRTKRSTVLVDLDYYRFGFVNPPKRNHELEYAATTTTATSGSQPSRRPDSPKTLHFMTSACFRQHRVDEG